MAWVSSEQNRPEHCIQYATKTYVELISTLQVPFWWFRYQIMYLYTSIKLILNQITFTLCENSNAEYYFLPKYSCFFIIVLIILSQFSLLQYTNYIILGI